MVKIKKSLSPDGPVKELSNTSLGPEDEDPSLERENTLVELLRDPSKRKIKKLFRTMDRAGQGHVSKNDVMRVLQKQQKELADEGLVIMAHEVSVRTTRDVDDEDEQWIMKREFLVFMAILVHAIVLGKARNSMEPEQELNKTEVSELVSELWASGPTLAELENKYEDAENHGAPTDFAAAALAFAQLRFPELFERKKRRTLNPDKHGKKKHKKRRNRKSHSVRIGRHCSIVVYYAFRVVCG